MANDYQHFELSLYWPWLVVAAVATAVFAVNVQQQESHLFTAFAGVPRRQSHRRSGLATLPSVGAVP